MLRSSGGIIAQQVAGGGSPTPLVTDGLVLRYEGTSGLTTGGWVRSTGAHDMVYSGAGSRSIISTPSGADGLRLSNGGQFLKSGVTDLPAGSAARTCIAVVRYEDPGPAMTAFAWGGGAPGNVWGISINNNSDLQITDFAQSVVSSINPGTSWGVQSATSSGAANETWWNDVSGGSGSRTWATTTGVCACGAPAGKAIELGFIGVWDKVLSGTELTQQYDYCRENYIDT